ncbi:MAG: hypothetical protein ACOYMD_12445 [Paludibacter sp.]
MKTIKITTEKRIYNSPEIELIKLDNEISLALQSAPPDGPGENIMFGSNTPEYFNNYPFKSNIG